MLLVGLIAVVRLFTKPESSAPPRNWKVVSDRVVAGAEPELTLLTSKATAEGQYVTLAFRVNESTGGLSKCGLPIASVRGVQELDARIVIQSNWKRRGCIGGWREFVVEFRRQDSPDFEFVWCTSPEAPSCNRYFITRTTATRLSPVTIDELRSNVS